jgi:hypothetical protein
MTKPDPISTSPLAAVAMKAIQVLDPLVGPGEAQMWMMRGNEHLGGITPIEAIKTKRTDELMAAVQIVAMERGVFEAPWTPPSRK